MKTNLLAAYVAAGLAAELPSLLSSLKLNPKASFEVGYNAACGLVAEGKAAAAETALRKAIKQGGCWGDAGQQDGGVWSVPLVLAMAQVCVRWRRGAWH